MREVLEAVEATIDSGGKRLFEPIKSKSHRQLATETTLKARGVAEVLKREGVRGGAELPARPGATDLVPGLRRVGSGSGVHADGAVELVDQDHHTGHGALLAQPVDQRHVAVGRPAVEEVAGLA